ncbi:MULTISPECIES: hypothetical protein [Geobacillus]|uniref:Uncharacterized protein n=3 Tax=Geobacillus TaxID=129337 RepID=A0A1Q5TA16_9BACL|nr:MULTISPECIES: hypothetical protein [Geobacillus]AMV11717.1 hypothetical protein GT3570_12365 [Geobacillus thermoleovorans]KDE46606.1 hypothetical protein DI43_13135 [Geobacillus sp. CAMR12739]AUI37763.1 hypothetical protein CWI35_15655 [[Bacillus] caldolyticus]ESU70486.1 hypothetical protein T260_18335 [Geobacillus sp. MAS1]KAF0994404.1 hypothetical protein BJQ97_01046 [Geobacillus sp. TFV-3]
MPALGAAIDLSGLTLPFSVSDLIGSVNSLISWVGPFVLLALALGFAPKIISFIKSIFGRATAK